MVERFFFQAFADAESSCYPNLPTKKGIGFSKEHAEAIGERVFVTSKVLNLPPTGSDVKGWEKNFSLECAKGHARHMKRTCSNLDSCQKTLEKVSNWWACSLVSTPHVLDSGELLVFDDTVVQRSGDFLTTSSNGSQRGTCAEAVDSVSIEMGDDCIEWNLKSEDELRKAYAEINLPVRDVEVHSGESFLFCSHRFERQTDGSWACWLETWQRMLFESSFSKMNDLSTNLNYMAEIEDMPDCPDKSRIIDFLSRRKVLLGAVAGHEKQEESDQDLDLSFESWGCSHY